MLIPGEAGLAPAPRIEPEPVDNGVDKGGNDKSVGYVKRENLLKKTSNPTGSQ